MKKPLLFLLMLLAFNAFCVSLAYPETEYHGADSVFEKEGIVILWAILKGQDEASSWVYTKIVNSEGNPFQLLQRRGDRPFFQRKGMGRQRDGNGEGEYGEELSNLFQG